MLWKAEALFREILGMGVKGNVIKLRNWGLGHPEAKRGIS